MHEVMINFPHENNMIIQYYKRSHNPLYEFNINFSDVNAYKDMKEKITNSLMRGTLVVEYNWTDINNNSIKSFIFSKSDNTEMGRIQYILSYLSGGKKSSVKKSPVKKLPVKKAPAKKLPVKKAPAKKAPVKKSPVKKSPVKK